MGDGFRQMSLEECEKLFRQIGGTDDIILLRKLFRRLLRRQPLLSYVFGQDRVYWRGRRCESEEGFSSLSEMIYPCKASATSGRLNDDNQPMLYAASRLVTVLNELSVREGDFIHYIGFVIKPGSSVRLGLVGEEYYAYHTGLSWLLGRVPGNSVQRELAKLGDEYCRRVVYVDAFLRNVLSDRAAEKRAYAHTRALGKEIFRTLKRIDGFFYPSTKHDVGTNLIVTPSCFDKQFKVITSSVLKVDKIRDFAM